MACSKRNALKQQSACMCCLYFTFSGLKNTSQLWRVYFPFHCLGFPQTGGTLNPPVRRPLCVNASSDLLSQTLIYWLSRTVSPHWILRRGRVVPTNTAHYKTSTTLESLQPKSFTTRSVWSMFDVLPPLTLCAYIMRARMKTRRIFTKCTKCTNREPENSFFP